MNMKRHNFVLSGFLCSILIVSSIPTSYSESDKLSWQLVYVTGNSKCTPVETIKTNEFFGIAEKYFEMYELEDSPLDAKCMILPQLSYYDFPENVQLVIIIFDDASGKGLLTRQGYEGIYSHMGNDIETKHTIMIKDIPNFSSYYDDTEPSWLLTNHISKFIMYYKGYSYQQIETILQPIEMKYDTCVGFEYTTGVCDNVKTMIKPDKIGKYFLVMSPIKNVVGNTNLNHISKDITSSKTVINLQREITTWWINDKITDADYIKSIKHLVNVPTPVNNTENISTMELPNGFIMIDFAKKKKAYEDVGPFLAFALENDPGKVFSYIPFEADDLTEDSESTIPDWFRMRAKLWTEYRLSDMLYFDGLESLLRTNSK
ncbi:hypothetical protein C6988_09140 [Nitrosopumilus sp. b1]|uniref:hypothetical protein n=1 Tax=Nitrosopumilus sp. b1 TaxID=2109907 RepID=UPI001C70DFA9|nr:hypothetical protein [Nitrosopumilus sp. b1]KAF6242372.1 hypothetical protein C6988_09140 [Nitrosopumilus sp. b1]